MVVLSPTSKEVLVIPSTWLLVVFSLCFGTIHRFPFGDSSGTRSLKTSRTVTLTLTLGELPLLSGQTSRVISLLPSVTSVVRFLDSIHPNLAELLFLLSSIVVINITICGDWAGADFNNGNYGGTCSDAVSNSKNYDCTNPFSFFCFGSQLTSILATVAQIEVNYISVYQPASC